MNDLNFFSLASDHGISGIMPFEVSKTCLIDSNQRGLLFEGDDLKQSMHLVSMQYE